MTLHATLSPVVNISSEAAARGRAVTNSRMLTCGVCGLITTAGPMARHNCDASYTAIHFRLVRRRGSARTHVCIDCGERSCDWSYDYRDPEELKDEQGRRYSLILDHYDPRCRPCHMSHDREKDPEMAERVAVAARAVPSEVRRRAGLASVGTPAGIQQRHDRAVKGGQARWSK